MTWVVCRPGHLCVSLSVSSIVRVASGSHVFFPAERHGGRARSSLAGFCGVPDESSAGRRAMVDNSVLIELATVMSVLYLIRLLDRR